MAGRVAPSHRPNATWFGVDRIHPCPCLGMRTRMRMGLGSRIFMAYPLHLKLQSLLFVAPCLAPALYFAWDG
jgi:hypothetical protein